MRRLGRLGDYGLVVFDGERYRINAESALYRYMIEDTNREIEAFLKSKR